LKHFEIFLKHFEAGGGHGCAEQWPAAGGRQSASAGGNHNNNNNKHAYAGQIE
jgi:hypothetical protein